MPNNSIEAEQAVLGSLLLSKEKYPEVDALINPSDFESEAHKEIYELSLIHISEPTRPC